MPTYIRPQTISVPVPLCIPTISNELLERLCGSIKPVIEMDGELFYIKKVDPREISFVWDPEPDAAVFGVRELVSMKTLHDYGSSSLFKPSIAEVIAQIPVGYSDRVVAFQTVHNRALVGEWSDFEQDALRHGYHVASTTLYIPDV